MDIKIQCCGFAILVFITYFCLRQKSIGTHSGNIEKIGERVFEKTCQFIVEKNIAQYGIEYIEINLSVKQCESPDFADKYIGIMEKYGVTFSLDDFGNGQSNLNYIVDMPVKIVKFDRDMTKAYFEKEKGRFVMNATIQMTGR